MTINGLEFTVVMSGVYYHEFPDNRSLMITSMGDRQWECALHDKDGSVIADTGDFVYQYHGTPEQALTYFQKHHKI